MSTLTVVSILAAFDNCHCHETPGVGFQYAKTDLSQALQRLKNPDTVPLEATTKQTKRSANNELFMAK